MDPLKPAMQTESTYKLGNFCIDEPRPMKVVIIGAGFSGVSSFCDLGTPV